MDQNGPFWSIEVHLGPPTVLWPFLIFPRKNTREIHELFVLALSPNPNVCSMMLPTVHVTQSPKGESSPARGHCPGVSMQIVDERQITHLICARVKYDQYDFFRGVFGPAPCSFSCIKGPKTPLKKSYRSYFTRAQIR